MPAAPSAATPVASCSFCEHDNPAGAKFCNECGSPLDLRPCIRCRAINHVGALHCHACGMAFQVELMHTDAVPSAERRAWLERVREVTSGRRLAVAASALVAALIAGVGFPLLQSSSEADRVVVESASVAPDAALREMPPDTAAVKAPAPTTEAANEPAPPAQAEMPQRDMRAEAAAPPAAAPAGTAKRAQSNTGAPAKRAASKSKSTNRSAAARKASRPKEPATSAR
jgi:hypothetical protein